jgi:hypothetical protein
MTTAYSREQLDQMEELFEKRRPRQPGDRDKRRLPMVGALSAAGAPFGLWIRVALQSEQFVLLFLNPVAALQLFHGINYTAQDGGWWKGEVGFVGCDLAQPTAEAADKANEIVSLTTASAGDLMMVHFVKRGGSKQMLGLWRQTAIDLFLTIKQAGEQFGWWDTDFQLQPAEDSGRITDLEVWRAASQLIEQNPDNAEVEAGNRYITAYSKGDVFNAELWKRIAKAVIQLKHHKPDNIDTIN